MQCSLGRFGGDTVLFVKPDNAIELVKVATQLGIDLRALEPKEAKKAGTGKPKGFKHEVSNQHECFYCGKLYSVKINRQKVWRHFCKDKKCLSLYNRDRYLYVNGRENEMTRYQLVRNLKEAGLNVQIDKR